MTTSAIERLHNRIDLGAVPFTERGSRLVMFLREEHTLFIRLAERWGKPDHVTGSYRQRAPLVDDFNILDGGGVPMPLAPDTYPHMVTLHSAAGDFDWAFEDTETLLVRLPGGRYSFDFVVWAKEGRTDRRGGTLRGKRNVAYTLNARITENRMEPLQDGPEDPDMRRFHVRVSVEAQAGDVLLLNVTPRLGYNRSIPAADTVIAGARARWDAWFSAAPPVADRYREQYEFAWWVMRAGLLSTRYYLTREALVPSKIHYVGVWHWDQFFHALAYRHVDAPLAEDQLRILLDHQQPNGMIPDAIHDEGIVMHLGHPIEGDVTKPPLLAWTVLKLYEKSGHRDFLDEVYEPLTRVHAWWMSSNTDENGLGLYRHPYSSGLDDSPLWDYGMPVVSPELNTYLYLQQESLARIAEILGAHRDAIRFRQGADETARRMLEVMWDQKAGLFQALYAGQPVPVLTPFSLLPMWTGRMPDYVVQRLLAHLTDPSTFWPQWPLPTVALSDPHFDPLQMWRGPVWVNVNYLFVEALTRIRQFDLADRLRCKTLELVMEHRDIYEYYNPLTGGRPPKAAPLFGWSAALFIDLAIQQTQSDEKGAGRRNGGQAAV